MGLTRVGAVVVLLFCQLEHAPLDEGWNQSARWMCTECPGLVGGESRLETGASEAAAATEEQEGNPGSFPRRSRLLRPLRRGALSFMVEGWDVHLEKR